ncbi:MAG: CDP-diacylglycerol/serine O-phosphatidyltransferase [Acidobacteria bacterium]|nr:CDP-diacylglycerol/serine O-phosphatidyltransferase [Acidobacteriota bacterium]
MIEPAGERDPGEPVPRHRRLGRSVFVLPSLFTVGNIFCGFYAILSTMNGNYEQAAHAIGIAIILDVLDGRIARATNSSTGFGLQLDSLADVISFGIAPSVLALVWGLSTVNYRLAWIAAFTFTICGAMRLARFNVQTVNLLMISTIRYSSLKHLTLGKKSHLTVLVMALLLALVVFLSRPTLLALAAAYVFSGPVSRLYGMLRRKKPSEEMTLADSVQHH